MLAPLRRAQFNESALRVPERSRSEHLDPWLDSHIQNTGVIRRACPDSDAALMRWQQKHANSRRRAAGEEKRAKYNACSAGRNATGGGLGKPSPTMANDRGSHESRIDRKSGRRLRGQASGGAGPMNRYEWIANRAYRLWEKAGRPSGRDWDFWLTGVRMEG